MTLVQLLIAFFRWDQHARGKLRLRKLLWLIHPWDVFEPQPDAASAAAPLRQPARLAQDPGQHDLLQRRRCGRRQVNTLKCSPCDWIQSKAYTDRADKNDDNFVWTGPTTAMPTAATPPPPRPPTATSRSSTRGSWRRRRAPSPPTPASTASRGQRPGQTAAAGATPTRPANCQRSE